MKISRKTIFDLERRVDLHSEYEEIMLDIEKTCASTKVLSTIKLNDLLNDCIKTWPYRDAAVSITSYAEKHGFNFYDAVSDEDILYAFELMINLFHWAPNYETSRREPFDLGFDDNSTVTQECTRCIENIECILEKLNMCVREIKQDSASKYVISKRDVSVDAAIEAVPELSEVLLSYLDVRNRDDVDAKKAILKTIADYLEPRRYTYKGTSYAGLCEDLFMVFNTCSIRHSGKDQLKIRKPQRIKLYDQTFRSAIHLLQSEEIGAFKRAVRELKEKK